MKPAMISAAKALTEQRRLLQIEYGAEKEAFTQLTERIGVTRLADRGNAWFPLKVKRTYYNSINQRILEVERTDADEVDHNFEYGKPVSLFIAKADGSVRHVFSGTVSFVNEDIMAVAISESADVSLLASAEAGVVLSFDETTYRTMMERIVKMHPECVTLLKMQYRMNEDIMRFSSNWFYDGGMEAAPEVKYRGILDYDTPVEWIDTSSLLADASSENGSCEPERKESDAFRESIAGDSFGRINRDEALITLLSLQNYIEKIGKERFLEEQIDVGLISPYRAQVRYLRHLIKRTPFFKPFRRLISVNTVDGFQGQERDVIVISMVRSNDEGNIGFLRDLRRMNVAMTRARMKLIIIGDVPTLTSHPFYRKLHHYVDALTVG